MNFMKSVSEIFTSLITWVSTGTKKITDFNVGSAARTLLESISLQIEEFYFDVQQAVRYAIENAIYNAFGFEKNMATKADGYVSVSYKQPLPSRSIVTAGTLVSTSPTSNHVVYYEVTEDVLVPAGASGVALPVRCTVTGTIGNAMAHEINTLIVTNAYVDHITNMVAFTNGVDEETSVQRKLRFKEYIRTLQRGTKEAIAYGVKSVLGVAGCWVDDNYIGFVRVYAHDSNGELGAELKSNILKALDEWRAAGIEVEVLPIVKVPTDITLNVVFKDSTDVSTYTSNLENLVTNFLNNFQVADNLYLSNLIATIMEGYKDVVVNIEITNGADTQLQNNELIVAGDVEVTGECLSDWRN